jgi:hypothetical protein
MANYSKLAGNIGADFQIDKTGVSSLAGGSGPGPQLGHISGDLVVATDLTSLPGSLSQILAQHVSSASQNGNTLTTFQMYQQRFVLAGSFSGASVPNNTSSMQFLVCHTAGGSWAVGDIAFDNGLNDGSPVIQIQIQNGYLVTIHGSDITAAGSLPTLAANSAYIWDGSAYQKFISGYTGLTRTIRVDFGHGNFAGGTLSSTATIPANATILRSRVKILTGGTFDGSATVSVGYTGQAATLMATTDSDLTTAGSFIVDGPSDNTDWPNAAHAVLLTLSGTPSMGAGYVVVEYTTPDT